MRPIGALLLSGLLAASAALGQTQLELDTQAGASLAKANADLNRAYLALMAKISPAGQQALRTAQRTWLSFRNQECDFETLGAQGGSVRPMVIAGCRERLTKVRLADIKAQLDCREGDVSCGDQ